MPPALGQVVRTVLVGWVRAMFSPACIVEVLEIVMDVVAAYDTMDMATIINSAGRKYLLLLKLPNLSMVDSPPSLYMTAWNLGQGIGIVQCIYRVGVLPRVSGHI